MAQRGPPLLMQINAAAGLPSDAERAFRVPAMNTPLAEQLKSLYAAFRLANIDFVLNAFDDQVEFISYSPLEVFPFLGHHRGKAAMERVLKAGYEQFEFVTYDPVFMVCEKEDAAVMVFARFIQRRTGRSITVMIAHFIRFRQGRIVELREFMDSFSAVKQLLGRQLDLEEH